MFVHNWNIQQTIQRIVPFLSILLFLYGQNQYSNTKKQTTRKRMSTKLTKEMVRVVDPDE